MQRVYNSFFEPDSSSRRPGTGRRWRTSNRDNGFIVNFSIRNRNLPTVQIRTELQHVKTINVSERTIKGRLYAANLVSRRPATVPDLT